MAAAKPERDKQNKDRGEDQTKHRVADAKFVYAGTKLADLPEPEADGPPEIAFAGRSNVGKSSLLNSLMQRRSLVRTSKTPGATRAINVFETKLVGGLAFLFADLPGYGFANRSRAERASWGPMLEGYLERRQNLVALVLLVDVRRGLEDDDIELSEFVHQMDRPLEVIVCGTKIDKLPVSKRKPTVAGFAKMLKSRGVPTNAPIGYSAVTHEGRARLWERLVAVTREAGEAP